MKVPPVPMYRRLVEVPNWLPVAPAVPPVPKEMAVAHVGVLFVYRKGICASLLQQALDFVPILGAWGCCYLLGELLVPCDLR